MQELLNSSYELYKLALTNHPVITIIATAFFLHKDILPGVLLWLTVYGVAGSLLLYINFAYMYYAWNIDAFAHLKWAAMLLTKIGIETKIMTWEEQTLTEKLIFFYKITITPFISPLLHIFVTISVALGTLAFVGYYVIWKVIITIWQ